MKPTAARIVLAIIAGIAFLVSLSSTANAGAVVWSIIGLACTIPFSVSAGIRWHAAEQPARDNLHG